MPDLKVNIKTIRGFTSLSHLSMGHSLGGIDSGYTYRFLLEESLVNRIFHGIRCFCPIFCAEGRFDTSEVPVMLPKLKTV